ncbi:hypothetical protein TCAL_06440 [Tigriopus californicus]|uniref:Uncharacterized protein n=2 Tax=Tigriopus californicus TaxID=6832 RepID=A0A553NPQ2_TIGCA|nr:hypothetical protein TCAL_06440 [Tigriopus californicus]
MNLLHNIPVEYYYAYFHENENQQALSLPCGNTICAEDPHWDSNPVPRLSELSVFTLARFFTRKPKVVKFLKGSDRALYLDLLSTDEPLTVTAEHIDDEAYWKKCCKEKLRHLYLERHLEGLLESFRPLEMDLYDIKELLPTLEPFIKKLNVTKLLPPIVLMTQGRDSHLPSDDDDLDDDDNLSGEGEEGESDGELQTGNQGLKAKSEISTPRGSSGLSHISADDSIRYGIHTGPEINMKVPGNHLDFGQILPSLGELEEFSVTYQLRNCGTDFRWNIYGMTSRDGDYLAVGLKSSKMLRKFSIWKSNLDDDKFYDIYDGLKNLTRLEVLEFSNNFLSDESATSLVRILNCNQIVHLDLTNNAFTSGGAEILAKFLLSAESKCKLKRLLFSLNNLRSEGCMHLCEALVKNRTLCHLDISSNRLDSKCAKHIAKMLRANQTLRVLNLSNNNLGPEGGTEISRGMALNSTLQVLDLRLTFCGKDVDLATQAKLLSNKSKPSGWSIRDELREKLVTSRARAGDIVPRQ